MKLCFYQHARFGIAGQTIDRLSGEWRAWTGRHIPMEYTFNEREMDLVEQEYDLVTMRADYQDVHWCVVLHSGGQQIRVTDVDHARRIANLQWVPIVDDGDIE